MKTERVQNYRVIIERGVDGYFIARVPELPGCHTQAKTYELVTKRIKDAIELCLEVAKQDLRYRKAFQKQSVHPRFIGIEDVAVKV